MLDRNFSFEVEDASLYLSCAIKTMRLLREETESELLSIQKSGLWLGPEHLLDICDAMCTVLRELERINDGLDGVVKATYEKRKKG